MKVLFLSSFLPLVFYQLFILSVFMKSGTLHLLMLNDSRFQQVIGSYFSNIFLASADFLYNISWNLLRVTFLIFLSIIFMKGLYLKD